VPVELGTNNTVVVPPEDKVIGLVVNNGVVVPAAVKVSIEFVVGTLMKPVLFVPILVNVGVAPVIVPFDVVNTSNEFVPVALMICRLALPLVAVVVAVAGTSMSDGFAAVPVATTMKLPPDVKFDVLVARLVPRPVLPVFGVPNAKATLLPDVMLVQAVLPVPNESGEPIIVPFAVSAALPVKPVTAFTNRTFAVLVVTMPVSSLSSQAARAARIRQGAIILARRFIR